MEEDKKITIPFAVTLTNSIALDNSIGNGMPFIPPALFDKLDVSGGNADIYGDKKENRNA